VRGGVAPRTRGHTIGRPCEIGVQVVFIPASSLVITTEDICRKGVHTGRLHRQVAESGGPRRGRVRPQPGQNAHSEVFEVKKNDNSFSAPESHIARLHNFTPQRAVPCLSTHSSLLDAPRKPPWIEGRALDAIPRKLCRCSPGLQ